MIINLRDVNYLSNRLSPIAEMLSDLNTEVFHYWRSAPEGLKSYIVWAEDGEENSLEADNKKQRQGIHGTIDLFTKTEFDSLADEIQEGLNNLENVSWRLESVQYEDETMFIHYEWEFWVR